MKPSVLSAFCLASLLSACSEATPPDGPPIEYGCLAPTRVFIFNEDEMRSTCRDAEGIVCDRPGLAFPKERETRLKLRIFDDDGRLCDPAATTVSFETGDFIAVADGNDVLVIAQRDAFDNALLEPSAVMFVSNGALTKRWQAMAVVDLVGTWEITVDDLTVGDFEVAQNGRRIRWAQCAPDDTRAECSAGEIRANLARLQSPIGTLTLEGAILPERDYIDGYWTSEPGKNSPSLLSGQWHARKLPE